MTDQKEALAAHKLARSQIAEQKITTFTPFKEGQKVWLETQNMKTMYHKKMTPKQEGPFEIEEVLGPATYQLKLSTTWKIHNVFHAILLKPYQESEIYGENFPTLPPEIINREEVYPVKTILKHRKRGQGYQYLIKWEGYPILEALWELESSFSGDKNLLNLYKKWHQIWRPSLPDKPQNDQGLASGLLFQQYWNLQSPHGGETIDWNRTDDWWDFGQLFLSSTDVPNPL